ncbi:MAG: ASKHA domain-containing protein, partial [Nitrososphaerota archaeon]
MELVIGIDIGTSGIRAQAIDAEKKEVISTAITLHNPLPGANSVEHLHFALKAGIETAQKIMIDAINSLLNALEVDLRQVKRLAVCGNPTQLSIFQGIEFRDLVYGGDRTLMDLGLKRLDRRSQIINNSEIGLVINPEAEICIPPAVRQQVGADALAMLIQADILSRKDNCMITDYGTNAEIALKAGDVIYTGSCAAGPAIEGGELERGMLASPGAISDISQVNPKVWKLKVLDKDMYSKDSYVVDPISGEICCKFSTYTPPLGITGTGTIALMATGFECGLIRRVPPFIMTPDHRIHLSRINDIFFTSGDYVNASRCFEAFKAGHTALVVKSGISFSDISAMYMCGAGGTYVDAFKAQSVGIVPPTVSEIYHIGNTSLAMAVSIAIDPVWLDRMQAMADSLKGTYVDFATDK